MAAAVYAHSSISLSCVLRRELIKLDRDWVPKGDGYSLYIRPTGISTHVRSHMREASLYS